ncbi:MAG TPA: hypothetical protein VIM04_10920 [Candidatus Binatia bacterium]|jgi:hypothetical protein
MRSAIKKYNTNYKKKVDVHRDSYLPRLAPKENAAAAAPFIIGAGGLSRRPWESQYACIRIRFSVQHVKK